MNGHCSVPQRHGKLSQWVKNQRAERKKGKLSEERVRKLDALGFDCDPRSTQPNLAPWDERLGELTKYKADHGHCNVPRSQGSLGEWVIRQRQAYKKGKLSEERVQKLGELGFVWNPQPAWDESLGELMKYKDEHGHCSVPRRHGPLGKWVSRQRQAYKTDKLSEERVQKLEDLGFGWDGWVAILKFERRPTRGSRPRSDAGEAREGEEDGGRERKRRNADADNDDAGTASAPALPEECVSNAAERDVETDNEIDTKSLKPEDVLIKAETDDESSR